MTRSIEPDRLFYLQSDGHFSDFIEFRYYQVEVDKVLHDFLVDWTGLSLYLPFSRLEADDEVSTLVVLKDAPFPIKIDVDYGKVRGRMVEPTTEDITLAVQSIQKGRTIRIRGIVMLPKRYDSVEGLLKDINPLDFTVCEILAIEPAPSN